MGVRVVANIKFLLKLKMRYSVQIQMLKYEAMVEEIIMFIE